MINFVTAHKPGHSKLLESMGNYEFTHFVIPGTQTRKLVISSFYIETSECASPQVEYTD